MKIGATTVVMKVAMPIFALFVLHNQGARVSKMHKIAVSLPFSFRATKIYQSLSKGLLINPYASVCIVQEKALKEQVRRIREGLMVGRVEISGCSVDDGIVISSRGCQFRFWVLARG